MSRRVRAQVFSRRRISADRRRRRLKVAFLAGAIGVALAGFSLQRPTLASADQNLNGAYTYFVTEEIDRGEQVDINTVRTWTVTPCGPGCAHVSSSADPGASAGAAYDGDLQLVDGVWQMTVSRPDLSVCNDGRRLPGTVSYSVDPTALTGTANGTVPSDCDGAPGGFHDTFMLISSHPA